MYHVHLTIYLACSLSKNPSKADQLHQRIRKQFWNRHWRQTIRPYMVSYYCEGVTSLHSHLYIYGLTYESLYWRFLEHEAHESYSFTCFNTHIFEALTANQSILSPCFDQYSTSRRIYESRRSQRTSTYNFQKILEYWYALNSWRIHTAIYESFWCHR